MGVGGTLEYVSGLISNSHLHKKKKFKQLQTVDLKVSMDCDGCELKVKRALSSLSGINATLGEVSGDKQETAESDSVRVCGMEASKVLKKAKSTGKKAEIWPYVPYNLVAQPYASVSYDKKAPPGYVRKVDFVDNGSTSTIARYDQDPFVSMFSDDNPNACSIM